MTFLISTGMIIFLSVVVFLLIAFVFWFNLRFYQERKLFKVKIETLQKIIRESSSKQFGQRDKIRLSDDLNSRLKKRNASLSEAIFRLNFELLEILSNNKLLKK